MTTTVAYVENDTLFVYPDLAPWAYTEGDIVYVREFPPLVTVEGGVAYVNVPPSGVISFEEWGEEPDVSLSTGRGVAMAANASPISLAAAGEGASISAESVSASLEVSE